MRTKDKKTAIISEFAQGYEKGYHSKDYTWEDGINYVLSDSSNQSPQYREGYLQGNRDRLRDEVQKWMC